jgi:hypothetical protein
MPKAIKKSPNPAPDAAVAKAVEMATAQPQVETPAPAPAEQQHSGIVDLLERASESQKAAIRKALGVQETIKPAKPKPTNADARQLLAANGGGTFHPPGFRPKPPQGVSDRGPEAVAKWMERWESGQTWGSRHAEIAGDGVDAEALAATAVE